LFNQRCAVIGITFVELFAVLQKIYFSKSRAPLLNASLYSSLKFVFLLSIILKAIKSFIYSLVLSVFGKSLGFIMFSVVRFIGDGIEPHGMSPDRRIEPKN